jgi:hypothetical protein
MKSILAASAAVFLLGSAAAHAQSLEAEKLVIICKKHAGCPGKGNGNGLALGQNPKLLAITREANAGIGNGAEIGKTEADDADPGNAGSHNQAADEDCGLVKECLEL